MTIACPVFNTTECGFKQLFLFAELISPSQVIYYNEEELGMFIQSAATGISTDIAARLLQCSNNKKQQQLNDAVQQVNRLYDKFYYYRRSLGQRHTYMPFYQTTCARLQELTGTLKLLYDVRMPGKFKLTDEQLVQYRRQWKLVLASLERKLLKPQLDAHWHRLLWIPLKESMETADTVITERRWLYLNKVAEAVLNLSEEEELTNETLFQTLLTLNFNTRAFRKAWQKQVETELQLLDIAARKNILKKYRGQLNLLELPEEKGMLPNEKCLSKTLKRWIDVTWRNLAAAEWEENRADPPADLKRLSLAANLCVCVALIRVLVAVKYITCNNLTLVFGTVAMMVSFPMALAPSADNMIKTASSLGVKDMQNLIDLLHRCLKKAEEVKRAMIRNKDLKKKDIPW